MKRQYAIWMSLILLASVVLWAAEGDRNEKVHNDKKDVEATGLWIYNDLPQGIAEAEKTGKPMLVVFR